MKTSNNREDFGLFQDVEFMFVYKGFTVMIFHDGRQDIIDMPLFEIEKHLADHRFFRIHKSYIVNLKRIRALEVNDSVVHIRMKSKSLPVSRRRKRALLRVLTK